MLSLTHFGCLEIRGHICSCSFLQNTFTIKITVGVLYVGLHSFFRLKFQNCVIYVHVNWKKILTCLGYRIIREKLPLVFCQNLSFLVLSILLCFNLILFGLFLDQRDVYHEIFLMDNSNKNLFKYSIATELSCATNITHRKEMGREFCVDVFWQGIEKHHTRIIIEWRKS